ncbi:MAG: response regulator [Boseongicola sp.]|nr:response regulator [Boseongicola sp.]
MSYANSAAVSALGLGASNPSSISDALASFLADPHGVTNRILRQAERLGDAQEDISTADSYLRLRAQKYHQQSIVWRIEIFPKSYDETREQPVDFPAPPSENQIKSTAQNTDETRLPPIVDIFDELPVPILKIAVDGGIISANASARRLLSLDGDDLPPLYDLVEGMGRSIAEWLTDAANGRGLLKTEFVRAVRPGQELFLQISLGRIEDNGRVELIGVLNDATELKSLEAQFVQSQKMQAIGQLAGGVAHDFNNLLTAISGHCDLLLLRHDEGDPEYMDLMQIAQNANRAASLVGQLLAFSRKQNLKLQPLDLRDTMSDLTHLLNRLVGEKITLELNIAHSDKVIRADRRQFEQVIMNLVVNARDAMPSGGVIEIDVEPRRLTEPLLRERADLPPGDYIVIKVKDNGTGIAPDKLPKIFEPFFTTKKTGEGTGLGLSTAYGIVKQTGGFIFAESTPNEGSLFSLFFPAHARTVEVKKEIKTRDEKITSGYGGGVVLLVEDEAPVRAFASRALRMRGHTVLEAENAEIALETLANPDLKVDIFVTDVIMPGLDGPTWVKKALETRPDTRVVFVSGYAEESLAENQMRVPNSVFLPKPFSLNQLTNVVHDQLQ